MQVTALGVTTSGSYLQGSLCSSPLARPLCPLPALRHFAPSSLLISLFHA